MTIDYRNKAQFPTTSEEDRTTSSSSGEETQPYLGSLHSPTTEYWIQAFIGEGTFGKVVKCKKAATKETVAVKIMKDNKFTDEMENELDMFERLRDFDPDKHNFVRFNDMFTDSGKACLEFELLDVSLWDFVGKRPSHSLAVKEIRPILHQMATTLELLQSQGIVHTDLKPDNIMLVDQANQPWKAKMIDFGLACLITESEWGNYVQPRYYRSPEVILGIPFTTATDMWSLGCIAAELYLGDVLYPGKNEYDMLRYMVQTQGNLPQRVLNHGVKTKHFFRKRRRRQRRCVWRLKTPVEYGFPSWNQGSISSLDDMKNVRPLCHLSEEDNKAEMEDRENFVDLLKSMLHLDVEKRLSPSHLLQDPFITMNDLASSYPNSFYVKSCCELMKVCQDPSPKPEDMDQNDDPQPSTSTAHQCQQGSHQAPPAWQSQDEHPDILEITSDVSSNLSILSGSQSRRSGTQSSSGRVAPASKRRRDTSSGEKSPESAPPERKRMKRDSPKRKPRKRPRAPLYVRKKNLERIRKLHQNRQATCDNPDRSPDSHSPEKKERTEEINPGVVQTLKDSPQDSRQAPTEVTSITTTVKSQRKRTWATFIASYTGLRTPATGSPERKRRKTSLHDDSEEAPAETSSIEAETKLTGKTKKRSLDDSEEAPAETSSSSNTEVKPTRKKRKTSLGDDSEKAPAETASPSSEADIKLTGKTKKRSLDGSEEAPAETSSSDPETEPTRKRKRKTSPHDGSEEASAESSSGNAETKPTRKTRKTPLQIDSKEAPTETASHDAKLKLRGKRLRTPVTGTPERRNTRKRSLRDDSSQEAPAETPSTEAEIKPTRPSRKRKRSTDEEETQTKKQNNSTEASTSKAKEDSSSDDKNRDCAPPQRKRRRRRRRISLEKQWTHRKCGRKRRNLEVLRRLSECEENRDV